MRAPAYAHTTKAELRIYQNHVRAHEALGGKTPSEAAGIKVDGDNRWLKLIQRLTTKRANIEAEGYMFGDNICPTLTIGRLSISN